MVTRADETAAEIEDGIQIDSAQRRETLDETHLVEDDGHDHGDEEFEEALDPQMDDPEPPGIDDGVVGLRSEEQRGQVEQRDRKCRNEKEVGKAPSLRIATRGRHRAPDEKEPEEEADGEQHLPEPTDLQVFPALIAEPEPAARQPLQ